MTTNYDRWLDNPQAHAAQPAAPSQATAESTSAVIGRSIYNVADFTAHALAKLDTVIHLHGSLADPGSMIITTQDYIRHYRNDRDTDENYVLTFLDDLFRLKTILFVGYGLEELEILEYVIEKARLQNPSKEIKHYALFGFFSHEEALFRSLSSYYAECGIEVIPYLRDQRDWAQLIEVLEEFSLQNASSRASAKRVASSDGGTFAWLKSPQISSRSFK